jgi:UDP:flavonoid glycosyltransferase YjiC (YdhE family)
MHFQACLFSLSAEYFIVWRALSKEDIEPNLPKNTYASEWIPQVHALDNCNTKVFISHGGMNGNKEAMLRGIPVISALCFLCYV